MPMARKPRWRSTAARPSAYVFKTMSEAHFGELSFFRVYSGSVTTGTDLFNSDRKITERIGQIYLLNGQTREAVPTLGAGDIGAVVKLKDTHTGNTLCTPKHPGDAAEGRLSQAEHPRRARRQGEGRGGQNRLRPRRVARGRPDVSLRRGLANCTRPSFPRRANCIWKSSPTVCAAGTTSTSNWPSRA